MDLRKPSQASDIAKGLPDNFSKKDGYYEGNEHVITWAFGHLVELQDATHYNPHFKWTLENLPIIPSTFAYKVKNKVSKQFNIIKSLINNQDIEKIVEAGDPGREGELILRLILLLCGNKKPILRFWISGAYTPSAVRAGMKKLRPGKDFDSLYECALARLKADWLVGINSTVAWTVKYGCGKTISVGRVQTPVLALIARRELEIKNFRSQDYWTINAKFTHKNGSYTGSYSPDSDSDESTKFFRKEDALSLASKIDQQPGKIESVIVQNKNEPPLHLFSLSELQKECNKIFDFTSEKTLDLLQILYEKHKVVSYPRTDCQYLGMEMIAEVPGILKKVSKQYNFNECFNVDGKNKRIFDDSKLTDHHAIIPTGLLSERFSAEEEALFQLICRRFVAAFMPDHTYQVTTIVTTVNSNKFNTQGKILISKGWRSVYQYIKTNDNPLPVNDVSENDLVNVSEVNMKADKTKPPARYTEGTIIDAMEFAGRYIDDANLKKVLKNTAGLGTSATRAGIIKTLKSREYIKLDKKSLIPTPLGMSFYETVKNEKIANPAFTAHMEQSLEEIRTCEKQSSVLMDEINNYVKEIIRSVTSSNKSIVEGFKSFGKCPACGKPVIDKVKMYACSDSTCKFVLWKNCLKKLGKDNITQKEIEALLNKMAIPLNNLQSSKGKVFSAKGILQKTEDYGWGIALSFDK